MVVILSGPVHSGKTNFLKRLVRRWEKTGYLFRGYLSLTRSGPEGTEYDFLDLKENKTLPFIKRVSKYNPEGEVERIGPFFFISETLDLARAIVRSARPDEVMIVDEIGPLEIQGRGVWPALAEALPRSGVKLLLVVREKLIAALSAKLDISDFIVIDFRHPRCCGLIEQKFFGIKSE